MMNHMAARCTLRSHGGHRRFARAAMAWLGGVSCGMAANYDWVGSNGTSWGAASNWSPAGVPGSADSVVVNRDLTAATTSHYAVAPEALINRQIASVNVTDSTAPIVNFTFAPGVAGSQLAFPTTSPLVSSGISNTNSGGQRLTIQNPLFQAAGTTLTKGGAGNIRLEFLLASGVGAFNSNVTAITSTGAGDLWISGPAGGTFQLPNVSFNANNTRLSLTGGAAFDVNSGVSVNTGTNEIYLGGGCTANFKSGSVLAGLGFTLSSNASSYYYTQGNSTLNLSGNASVSRIRWAEYMSGACTATVNVTGGTTTVTGSAATSYAGNPVADSAVTQASHLNVSGGGMIFGSATSADFNFGQSTRNSLTVPSNLTTVTGRIVVSGTGSLSMGTASRLVLGARNGTNTIVNTDSSLHLNGGTFVTAREIARGTIGSGAGTTQARIFLNGGTLRAAASVGNLFTNFVGASDGVFVSSGGAVIDTQGYNVGIGSDLLENPSSLGGGLTKSGSGILSFSGAYGISGPVAINGGSVRFNRVEEYTLSQPTSGPGGVTVQQGRVVVTSPDFSPSVLVVGAGSNSVTPDVSWSGNGTIAQSVINDQSASVSASLSVDGGNLILGGSASSATYPGFFVNALTVGGKGAGRLLIQGGTFTANDNKRVIIGGLPRYGGSGVDQVGVFKIVSGLADLKGTADLWIGYSQNNADSNFTGSGTVVLDGGVLQTSRSFREYNYLGVNNAGSSIIFNGGMLRAGGTDNPNWIEEGAIDSVTTTSPDSAVDTNGRTMRISAAVGGAGGMTKAGLGILTMAGLNSYLGETRITQGTLGLSRNGSLADGSAVRIAKSGATLHLAFQGEDAVDRLYIDGIEQVAGTWGSLASAAANKTALITGDGIILVVNGAIPQAFHESSNPPGIISPLQLQVLPGSQQRVRNFPVISGSYRFGFWTFNGVRQSYPSGQAYMLPAVTVNEPIDAVANFFPVADDGDGDRLPDWWEYWMFGDRSRGPQDDDDGDGQTNEKELHHGYSARFRDEINAGGISARLSAPLRMILRNRLRYTLRSAPLGLVSAEGELTLGGSYTTPYLAGDTSGHTFVGFEVNGQVMRDVTGHSLDRITITPAADTEIVARYVPAGSDSDADGVPDAVEWRYFGTLAVGPGSDPDGDGLSVAEERRMGLSLATADRIRDGGIAARLSAPLEFDRTRSRYTVLSHPLGLITSTSEMVATGSERLSPHVGPALVAGHAFGYWSLNGQRIAGPDGLARRQVKVPVNGTSELVAHFFLPDQDSDADGLPDGWEWNAFGNLTNSSQDDPDGDGFVIAVERQQGLAVTNRDLPRDGGISTRLSAPLQYESGTRKRLAIRSTPRGIVTDAQSSLAVNSTVTSTHYSFANLYSGYQFTHWTRNGTRLRDAAGFSRNQAVFGLQEDTELVAHFLMPAEDRDADTLPDHVEYRLADTLTVLNPDSDPDGDGMVISKELSQGLSALVPDIIRDGGIAARLSAPASLQFSVPPLVLLPERLRVAHGAAAGTSVASLSVSPTQPGRTHQFALELGEGSDDNARFAIAGNELRLTAAMGATERILRIRIRGTDDRGVVRSWQSTIMVGPAVEPPSYATWSKQWTGPADPSALADPDGDGFSNLIEYVIGGNPLFRDRENAPSATLVNGNLIFTFRRSKASRTPDIAVRVESGEDAVNWTRQYAVSPGTPAQEVSISDESADYEIITVTIPGRAATRFARLKVIHTP